MKIPLGLPYEPLALGPRLATLTLFRLIFLSALLVVLAQWHLRDVHLRAFSVQIALIALAIAFALAAGYALVLRSGKRYRELSWAQIFFDQATWTALVYVTGGAASGASSLYGLTVVTGAVVSGLTGAAIAAVVGYVFYISLSLMMIARWIPVPSDQLDVPYALTLEQAASPLALNLLVITVVTLLSGYLAERLRLTGGKLEEVTERAMQAERLAYLGKVAAGLAHEIRNPLGSITASIELLHDTPGLSQEDRKLCEIIKNESSRLNDLVGDMLDLARPRKPDFQPTNIIYLLHEVVTLAHRSGRGSQDVQVALVVPDEPSAIVDADPAHFRQLVWNLVRNAVQATSPGSTVTLRLETVGSTAFLLEVEDAGAGIPEEIRAHLFEAFVSTRVHGSGIGLAVVKRITEEHGWTIEAVGNRHGGATFRLSIPRNQP
jgi:signal transduction histidine kinase